MNVNPKFEKAFYRQTDVFKKICGMPSEALGLALRMQNGYKDDWGLEEYSVITVNLPGPSGEPEFIGMKNSAYMDINNCPQLCEAVLKEKFKGRPVATNTGFTRRSGFVEYPLYQFDEEWLRSIPVTYGSSKSYEEYEAQYVEDEDECE